MYSAGTEREGRREGGCVSLGGCECIVQVLREKEGGREGVCRWVDVSV